MQHHFGQASIFLTVSFDDENSFLIQVMSGLVVDNIGDLSGITDEELHHRSLVRRTLRLNYPGICAINFEVLLEIVLEEVVGWDRKTDRSIVGKGLFGEVKAFMYCIEEQGRKSLHAHMLLWVEGYDKVMERIFFGKKKEQLEARRMLNKYQDNVATTRLFPTSRQGLSKATDHDCTVIHKTLRELPAIIGTQGLRNLRHIMGYKDNQGVFATCLHCQQCWTYEELLGNMLEKSYGIHGLSTGSIIGGRPYIERLRAECVRLQIPEIELDEDSSVIINATYQHHLSCHSDSCFKCRKNKKKGSHKCNEQCECRFRLPDQKRNFTAVTDAVSSVNWYTWRGTSKPQPLLQSSVKRAEFDAFQNVSCQGVSETKLTCNSNVALVFDGPLSQYIFKYICKSTKNDDEAEFAHVSAAMKTATCRVHDDDVSEALRLIRRAAFGHNKRNIINPPMASFLLRNESRFKFSHTVVYCPLNDLIRLHEKTQVSYTVLVDTDGSRYFENQAIHYVCRPSTLEGLSLKDFVEEYRVTYWTSRNQKSVTRFLPGTEYVKHPSVVRQGKMLASQDREWNV
jgi:hypothetical protein